MDKFLSKISRLLKLKAPPANIQQYETGFNREKSTVLNYKKYADSIDWYLDILRGKGQGPDGLIVSYADDTKKIVTIYLDTDFTNIDKVIDWYRKKGLVLTKPKLVKVNKKRKK